MGNINETFLPETSINNFGVGCRTNGVEVGLFRDTTASKEWIACDADHPDAKWRKDESITDRELARRVCWEKMVGVMTNVGARPKEYQGLRCRDIVETDNPDPEIRNNCTIHL